MVILPTDPSWNGSGESRVSVIIPARNAAAWIRDALDSVAAQDHPALEVIVVDDGSTDSTASIASEFAGRLDLQIIRESGRGPAAARNRGLDAATGQFLQFLDADDVLEPWKVSRQVDVMQSTNADVVWGGFQRAFDTGMGLAAAKRVDFFPTIGDDPAADLITETGFVQLGALLARRGTVGSVRMPESMRVVEDLRYQFALIDAGARYERQPGLSGFVMREHASPERASRQSPEGFWLACMDNAENREATWQRTSTLTPPRARSLAAAYVAVARELAVINPRESRRAEARAFALYPRYFELVSERLRLPTRLFGLQRVEALATVGRSIRRALAGGT